MTYDHSINIFSAIQNNDVENLKGLLSSGADLNLKDHFGLSPLHYSALKWHLDCLRELINASADIHAKNQRGDIPLHIAISSGYLDCVQSLLESGASPSLLNLNHQTAKDLAASHDHRECVKLIPHFDPIKTEQTLITSNTEPASHYSSSIRKSLKL